MSNGSAATSNGRLAVAKKKNEVLKALKRWNFADRISIAIPLASALGWIEGPQYNHGRLLIITSRISSSTEYITAEISTKLPRRITFEKVMYRENASSKGTYGGLVTPLTTAEIVRYQESGGELQNPFDKAVRDTSNANQNLSTLVQWYYMSYGMVDVFDDDCNAFAQQLKETAKSICLNGTPDRRERRSRVPVQPSNLSAEAAGRQNSLRASGVERRPSAPASDTDYHSSGQHLINTTGEVEILHENEYESNCSSASVHELSQQLSSQDASEQFHAINPEMPQTAAQTAVSTHASGEHSVQSGLQHILLEKCLLKYSNHLFERVSIARHRIEGYTESVIFMQEDDQRKSVFASLKADKLDPRVTDQPNAEVDIHIQDGESIKQVGVSIPRSVQKMLRRPFSQAISLDVQLGQKVDGGDRLYIFCKYMFVLKKKLPWSTVTSRDVPKIADTLAFMRANEPESRRENCLITSPTTPRIPFDFPDEDDSVDVSSSVGPLRRIKPLEKRAGPLSQKWERLGPQVIPFSEDKPSATPNSTVRPTSSSTPRTSECNSTHALPTQSNTVPSSRTPVRPSRTERTESPDDAVHVTDQLLASLGSETPSEGGRSSVNEGVEIVAARSRKRGRDAAESEDIHAQAKRLKDADIANAKKVVEKERDRIRAELWAREKALDEFFKAEVTRIQGIPDHKRVMKPL